MSNDIKTVGTEIVSEIIMSQVTGKKWYKSKTVWANSVLIGAIGIQVYTGFLIPLELQTFAVSMINIALRKITKEEIIW